MMLSQKILNTVLQDDETEFGGVSCLGETALDFLQSIGADKSQNLFMKEYSYGSCL